MGGLVNGPQKTLALHIFVEYYRLLTVSVLKSEMLIRIGLTFIIYHPLNYGSSMANNQICFDIRTNKTFLGHNCSLIQKRKGHRSHIKLDTK